MKHDIKTLSKYFQSSWVGRKSFEIRKNDRNYNQDDEIILIEIDDDGCETGRVIYGIIQYITDYEQKDGYVVFELRIVSKEE